MIAYLDNSQLAQLFYPIADTTTPSSHVQLDWAVLNKSVQAQPYKGDMI